MNAVAIPVKMVQHVLMTLMDTHVIVLMDSPGHYVKQVM